MRHVVHYQGEDTYRSFTLDQFNVTSRYSTINSIYQYKHRPQA